MGPKGPIHIVSGYRSPDTNAKLRKRSRGVARFSRHMSGQAIDYFIPGVPIEDVRNAGLRLQRGGVGYYPSSGVAFVHMDVGSVRHWPRIPEQQLARVMNSRTAVAAAKPAAEEPKRDVPSAASVKAPAVEDDEEEEVPATKRGRMPAVAARALKPAAPTPEAGTGEAGPDAAGAAGRPPGTGPGRERAARA